MRRRDFVGLAGGAPAWPLAARAQQSRSPVIGYLGTSAPEPSASFAAAFRKGLSEGGYNENRNVTIEYRWGSGANERLPELAADLVRRRVRLIFTSPAVGALAAKAATSTIPIIFYTGGDPVQFGLVASLNRRAHIDLRS
jgi:putative tryptophan/tyrosine transport system substrate-binding protein